MENRRQHYRYVFAPTHRLPVQLVAWDGLLALNARIVNLSVWGICVAIDAAPMPAGERWQATFSLGTEAEPLTIPVERVHAQNGTECWYGFRFMQTLDLAAQERREKAIWRYLLEEQRRQRREKE